jgi:hypothetical protein
LQRRRRHNCFLPQNKNSPKREFLFCTRSVLITRLDFLANYHFLEQRSPKDVPRVSPTGNCVPFGYFFFSKQKLKSLKRSCSATPSEWVPVVAPHPSDILCPAKKKLHPKNQAAIVSYWGVPSVLGALRDCQTIVAFRRNSW